MGRFAQKVIAEAGKGSSEPQQKSYVQRAIAQLAAKQPSEVVEEAAFVEEPRAAATIGQMIGRPIAAGVTEAAAAYSPPYVGSRAIATALKWLQDFQAGKPTPADVIAGATPEDLELGRAAIEELDPAGRLKALVDLPVTLAEEGVTAAFGEPLPEDDPSARFERYAKTAGTTVGGAAGLGQSIFSLFGLSGPAAAATEEALRLAKVDPELAEQVGKGVEYTMMGADVLNNIRKVLTNVVRSPAQKIAALLGETDVQIMAEAEQLMIREGITFEQATQRIQQAQAAAAARLGKQYIPVYTDIDQGLQTVRQSLLPGGESQKAVDNVLNTVQKGQSQALEQGYAEAGRGLGEAQSTLTVGQQLKQKLTAVARAVRKPISSMYKSWDRRFGRRMVPIDPQRLLDVEAELERVKATISAQRGQATAVGDMITGNRMSEALVELTELEDHLVGVSVAKLRRNISNFKRKLREAGLGDSEGMYGQVVQLLEGVLEEGLSSVGLAHAIPELREANKAWRAYAERYYNPAVARLINESGEGLARATTASLTEANATAINAALGNEKVDAFSKLLLDKSKGLRPAERISLLRQMFPNAKESQKVVELISAAENSVSVTSLQRARADLVRAAQNATGEERKILQDAIASIDNKIDLAGVTPKDRQAVSLLKDALKKDQELLDSNFAREIRARMQARQNVDTKAKIIEDANSLSQEAGAYARRVFLEELLLPNGANTTAREVASAFRKHKKEIQRIIGETEITEKDLHELMQVLDQLAENLSRSEFLNMKSGFLHELFESMRTAKAIPQRR